MSNRWLSFSFFFLSYNVVYYRVQTDLKFVTSCLSHLSADGSGMYHSAQSGSIFKFYFHLFVAVLGNGTQALCMLDKCSRGELHPQLRWGALMEPLL
jgi:hypothetical protein